MLREAVTAFVALGANLGRPEEALLLAIQSLDKLPATRLIRSSSLYRSAPVGAAGPDFINAVVELSTRLSAPDLLTCLQGLEQFTGMMSAGQIAVAQPDLAMIGGITPSFMLAQTAEAFGVVVAPHFLPNLFAHVAAAAPTLTWLEDFPLLEPLFDDPAGFDARGELSPSSIPGHGLEITPETRARFLKPSWTSA